MDAANPRQVLFSQDTYLDLVGNRKIYQPGTLKSPAYFKGPYTILVKHGLQLNVYIMHMGNENLYWNSEEPHNHRLQRKTISGKVPRTRFIVDRLHEILLEGKSSIEIYEQAALSTFSISTDQVAWKTNPNYSKTYFDLLTKQREALDDLAKKNQNIINLIIYPDPVPASKRKSDGLKELIDWMEGSKSFNNIDWVKADYQGRNRLIIANRVYIEGQYKGEPGYEVSNIETNPEKVRMASIEFRKIFQQAKKEGQTKESVIEGLRRQL